MDGLPGLTRQGLAYKLTFGLVEGVRELWEMVGEVGLQYPPNVVTIWEASGAKTLFRDRSELWKVSWRRGLDRTFDTVLGDDSIHCFISDRALAVLFNNRDWGRGNDGSLLPGLKQRIENILGLKFIIGVGGVYSDARQLGLSFRQAKKIVERLENDGCPEIDFFDMMSGDDDEPLLKTEKMALGRAIAKRDRREIAQLIQRITGMMIDKLDYTNLNSVKMVIFELLAVIVVAALESGWNASELFPYSLEWITKLHKTDEVPKLNEMITVACETVLAPGNSDQNVETKVITRAKQFLESHLAEDLSLSEIARRQFLSPWYFSRLFKQSTGLTVTEFLTALRVTKAKELLEKTNQPVGQVAGTVGYSDPNYFSRVFKRCTGTTPSEYRARY